MTGLWLCRVLSLQAFVARVRFWREDVSDLLCWARGVILLGKQEGVGCVLLSSAF